MDLCGIVAPFPSSSENPVVADLGWDVNWSGSGKGIRATYLDALVARSVVAPLI